MPGPGRGGPGEKSGQKIAREKISRKYTLQKFRDSIYTEIRRAAGARFYLHKEFLMGAMLMKIVILSKEKWSHIDGEWILSTQIFFNFFMFSKMFGKTKSISENILRI